jgi:hypothetical protein
LAKTKSDTVQYVRASAFAILCGASTLITSGAWAESQTTLSPDAQIEISAKPEAGADKANEADAAADRGGPAGGESTDAAEAPPPTRPRGHGLVIESTAGMLGFIGQFRHLAPPAYFMHAQLGYELLPWLQVFGEADLALTSTSEAEDPSHSRAFPIWGFGGGARLGWRSKVVGAFVQGDVGALTAVVPHDALTYLGFHGAESLGLEVGGRIGVEWYQRDRHLALTLQGGPRLAQGFSRSAVSDIPLMWDTALGIRYGF